MAKNYYLVFPRGVMRVKKTPIRIGVLLLSLLTVRHENNVIENVPLGSRASRGCKAKNFAVWDVYIRR